MNPVDIILIIILSAIICLAVASIIRKKGKGCGECCGNCTLCKTAKKKKGK